MKRAKWLAVLAMSVGMMAGSAMAQDRPEPAGPGPRQPGGPDGRPALRPPRGEGDRPEASRDGDRPGMGMMRRPEAARAQTEMMRSWLETVERYSNLAHDPSATAVAAVVTAGDLLRQRGPEAAIEYFNGLLPEVRNDAVRRAIRLQLVELYKASGQADKALDQLRTLITTAPGPQGSGRMPPPPPKPGMPDHAPGADAPAPGGGPRAR